MDDLESVFFKGEWNQTEKHYKGRFTIPYKYVLAVVIHIKQRYEMFTAITALSIKIKREVRIYRSILKDTRTPLISKIHLWVAVGYLLMRFDLIPDWIPVLGHADDSAPRAQRRVA